MSVSSQQEGDRKTISEKKSLVEKWSVSKAIMRDFCNEHQISQSALKYWSKQFGMPSKRPRKKKSFLPLKISTPLDNIKSGSSIFAEIISINGTRVLFHQPIDITVLKALIQ